MIYDKVLIALHPSLFREFADVTKRRYLQYTSDQFLASAERFLRIDVAEEAIIETREAGTRPRKVSLTLLDLLARQLDEDFARYNKAVASNNIDKSEIATLDWQRHISRRRYLTLLDHAVEQSSNPSEESAAKRIRQSFWKGYNNRRSKREARDK